MKTKSILTVCLLAALALILPANFASAKQGSGNGASVAKIRLTAAAGVTAKGSAKIKVRANEQEFEVEAQVSRKSVGAVLGVVVNDVVVGTMTVNKFGKAKLELNSENGDEVPVIAEGTIVSVVNADGVIILAGQF